MVKVFVVLVVMNLDEVATDGNLLPSMEVDTIGVADALLSLTANVGLIQNLGSVKLVGVRSVPGMMWIGYRVRTRSRTLVKPYTWKPVSSDLASRDERYLVDLAWESEQP